MELLTHTYLQELSEDSALKKKELDTHNQELIQ
jgi:hypothetical protein